GIKNYTSSPDYLKVARNDYSKEEVLALVRSAPLDFVPGAQFNYSNTGYFLLGMLLEKVSGKPYGELLEERVCRRLGMSATPVNEGDTVLPQRAAGYEWGAAILHNAPWISMTQPYAAGALVSSVVDLARWDAALYTEKLLRRSSLERMWTPAR